jgi:hypothetical protein
MKRTWQAAALGVCAALLGMQAAAAAAPEFQITPRVGQGSLHLDQPIQSINVEDTLTHDRTLGLGAGFGYLTSRGVVFEIGADSFGTFDLFDTFDSFSLQQKFASVGYQAELGRGWRLVPRVGRARWKLKAEEGWAFNPGPEEAQRLRGWNYYWELSLSHRISRVVAMGVQYKQGDYDFGRTRSTTFLVTLGF